MRGAKHVQPQRALVGLIIDELPLPGQKPLVLKSLDRLARTKTHIAGKNIHSVCPSSLLFDVVGGFTVFGDGHNSPRPVNLASVNAVRSSIKPQHHRFESLAIFRRQGGLRWNGITDVVSLDGEARLDAGGEIIAGKRLVKAPKPPLQGKRIIPAPGSTEIIQLDALPRDQASRTSHPADAADQHHRGADAEKTFMPSPHRLMIDSSRPVLVEAS